jgi:2-hydroxycyclohexanecarboxyl-CoA dehydrogenase
MSAKVALVTGGAAGIGAAISRRLARDDIAIGVLDLSIDDAAKVADEIAASGGRAIPLHADITHREQVEAAVAKLRSAFGPVTIVVNNAGITGFVPFEELTDAQWDKMMEVNLKGPFIVTQVVLPDMKAARWGRIVNISSSSAQSGAVRMAHYVSSKAGLIGFTKALALELGPKGITVNTIPPGFVDTPMLRASEQRGYLGGSVDDHALRTPVRRPGRPEDIAAACAFLVSEEAGYVTGQVIGVNGGRNT